MKIEKSDRRLLLWAALFLLPVIVALALLSQDEEESVVPSSYSAQTRGAKAAYLLLQDMGYQVERWQQPPQELPSDPTHTVLVMAGPLGFPSKDEKNALQLYLSHGGKMLITGPNPWMYLPHAVVEDEPLPSPSWRDYQPQLLTPLTRSGTIQMSPAAYWKDSSVPYLVHYADEGRPIVISSKIGGGEVIWWAASTPLSNAAIARSGNMALLLNSLGPPEQIHIYWDEYFHGYRSSFSGYLSERPVFYGLLQCALVFAALLFTFSRRHGPIHPLPEPSRLSPLEFVHTLGRLYHRANAVHATLAVPYTRFRMLATRQLGLGPQASLPDLAQALNARLRRKSSGNQIQIEDLLRRIEAALQDPGLPESTALDLARQLALYTQELKQETIAHADSVPGAHARTN